MGEHVCTLADDRHLQRLVESVRGETSPEEVALAYLLQHWSSNAWFERMAHQVFCEPRLELSERQIQNLLLIKANVEAERDMRFLERFANGR